MVCDATTHTQKHSAHAVKHALSVGAWQEKGWPTKSSVTFFYSCGPLCTLQIVCPIALSLQRKSVILRPCAVIRPAILAVHRQESTAGHKMHVKWDLHKQCCSITYLFFPSAKKVQKKKKKGINKRCRLASYIPEGASDRCYSDWPVTDGIVAIMT